MGILSRRRDRRAAERVALADGVTAALVYTGGGTNITAPTRYASPWSTSNMERWAYQDMFGDLPLNNRENAMAIPASARASSLIKVQGAKQPVVELEGDTIVAEQPNWITQTGDGSSPYHRMLWTIDDLIWTPASLWWRDKPDTDDETRCRVNLDDWEIDYERREVLVNGSTAGAKDVILIPGSTEGVLNYGRRALLSAIALYGIYDERVANPVPQIELHQTKGPRLNKTERDELIAGWRDARSQRETQGVAYTSEEIEVIERGQGNDSQLLIEARNAAALDIARMIGVHGSMIDATTPTASLNYETTSGRNQEFSDLDLDTYLLPIAARLSLDDVCAPGRRVAFDRGQFTTLTPLVTGPSLED